MKLNYKRLGSGPPTIVLHGFLGMLDNWQAPARGLEDLFEVILVDQRNHGHSPHSDEFNYDVLVADVLELMDDLHIPKAHIIGHSMGGKVAMRFAQRHPERINKLVVVDIGPKFYPVHHQKIFEALFSVPLDQLQRRGDAEPYLAALIPEPGVRQFLMKNLYHPDRGAFAWRFALEALWNNIDNVGESMDDRDYEGETLFVRGSRSSYITDADWADIKVLFPMAFLETIDDAGHWVHAEQPEAFVIAVRSFLVA